MRLLIMLALLGGLAAQNQPLNPTGNLVIDTTATQGQFAFSHIDIPVGVRVTFSGTYPVQIRCDGDAVIDGQFDVDAGIGSSVSGPGGVMIGAGLPGYYYYGPPCGNNPPPTNGSHAGAYGTTMPFSLAGGSPGGQATLVNYFSSCQGTVMPGGGAGGTLTLEAMGRIDVHGRVSANGGFGLWMSCGSGGSILLRGLGGVTVHPAAIVQAACVIGPQTLAPGIIRIDSYGSPPVIQSTITPAPFTVELPYLQEMQPPLVGNVWQLRVAAPRGDGVSLALSFGAGSFANQWGMIALDPATAIPLGLVVMPSGGHDPLATYQLPVPNDPSFIGTNLHVAGLDWMTTLQPRFTNTIHTSVQ